MEPTTRPRPLRLHKPGPAGPATPRPHLRAVAGQAPSPADLMFAAACRRLVSTLTPTTIRSA